MTNSCRVNKTCTKKSKYIAFHDTQTYGTRSEEFMGRVGSNGLLTIIHSLLMTKIQTLGNLKYIEQITTD